MGLMVLSVPAGSSGDFFARARLVRFRCCLGRVWIGAAFRLAPSHKKHGAIFARVAAVGVGFAGTEAVRVDEGALAGVFERVPGGFWLFGGGWGRVSRGRLSCVFSGLRIVG